MNRNLWVDDNKSNIAAKRIDFLNKKDTHKKFQRYWVSRVLEKRPQPGYRHTFVAVLAAILTGGCLQPLLQAVNVLTHFNLHISTYTFLRASFHR